MWSASYSALESALSSCAALISTEEQIKGMFVTPAHDRHVNAKTPHESQY